ncbi:FAEL215Cp [Eremothecium gossypii FDAG1]|nr:FAEL215Cp [Eremothecium gossypii FDAG1]
MQGIRRYAAHASEGAPPDRSLDGSAYAGHTSCPDLFQISRAARLFSAGARYGTVLQNVRAASLISELASSLKAAAAGEFNGGRWRGQPGQLQAMVAVYAYPDTDALAQDLGEYIVAQQDAALAAHGQFAVAVSGGSLVGVLAAALLHGPAAARVRWAQWHVFFCDERLVPLEHAESNYHALRTQLLDPLAAAGALGPVVHSFNEALLGQGANERIAEAYEAQLPVALDLALLGAGPDGHTASLFPGPAHAWMLDERRARVLWCRDSPKPPADRITLTLPALEAAAAVAFVAEGTAKRPVLERALVRRDPALPCAVVTARCARVAWFTTAATVQDLPLQTAAYCASSRT